MKVVVIASYVSELIFRVPRLMRPGETQAGAFREGLGGKGFNMTIAAGRCGAEVLPVMKLGTDAYAAKATDFLRSEGISCDHVNQAAVGVPSGCGVILVGDDGENAIAIDPGANALLDESDIGAAQSHIASASVVLAQLECPVAAVLGAFRLARAAGVMTVLNPAPAPTVPLPDELLALTDVITPNESEAAALTGYGVDGDWRVAARRLQSMGPGAVAITLGSRGVGLLHGAMELHLPAPTVDAIDTSGAGDAFNGALVARLASGHTLEQACLFAVRYAAIQVTRRGTSSAMPWGREVP
ncbi:ribokinase [Luteolibacter arcticus]|uniref:Ribokinase n=1 Tax=Luteolibacter arcticus TaxID=1581411 RepID=A0ABT3GIS2_9BACT|nr:ribokinase [Luteolibacter arcticus]MCW1923399.1 ribokinase [Luteolibacter arcticus]